MKLIREADLLTLGKFSKATRRRLTEAGKLPAPRYPFGPRSPLWDEEEVTKALRALWDAPIANAGEALAITKAATSASRAKRSAPVATHPQREPAAA